MKTQTIDNPTLANPKERKLTHYHKKITGLKNHWSLTSPNINGLNSAKTGYEHRIQPSSAYKKNTSTSKTNITSE